MLSLVTCIAFAAIGCGGGGDASGRVQTDAPQIPLGGTTTATASQTTPQPSATAARVGLKRIGTFESPTYLTAPPGDTRRVFVVEQRGTIREVLDGRKLAKPFLDIHTQVQAG